MLFLNHDFFTPNDIVGFINASFQIIIQNNPSILASKEYRLYYYIRENFSSNFYSLYNTDIDMDCLGFSVIQRNTRHSIEAFLDLVNLCIDPDYISVLEYNANKGKYNSKYQPYIKGNFFDIPAKYETATKMYKRTLPKDLINTSSKTNKYTHPNVFIDILNSADYNKKAHILKKLLKTNLDIFTSSYQLLIEKFNNNIHPCLNCPNCNIYTFHRCDLCYDNECKKFQNLIDNGLFTYTSPTFNSYQK